jgi:hypothetical protein
MDDGLAWRTHCWRAARERLLPTLPIEVLRTRVRRAQELGLEYKTYASVRASTGHDVVAFLFSSNALRARPALPEDRVAKLQALVDCGRIALATAPLAPHDLLQTRMFDSAHPAPDWLASFSDTRRMIRAALTAPGDRVVLIGDHGLEQDWCAAGGLAGYVPAERYFGR